MVFPKFLCPVITETWKKWLKMAYILNIELGNGHFPLMYLCFHIVDVFAYWHIIIVYSKPKMAHQAGDYPGFRSIK
jgi:hypothetical protein